MLITRIRTTIIALVAAGSITAASMAPQADAATTSAVPSGVTLTQTIMVRPTAAASTATRLVVAWTTKFGTGPAKCSYSDGSTADEGEQVTVMVFLDDGTAVSYKVVCGADGKWHGA